MNSLASPACRPPMASAEHPPGLSALSKLVHELRTPISGVVGVTQLLSRDPRATDEQRQWLALIDQCGQHLLQLVGDIMDYSRLRAGAMPLTPTGVSLRALLQDVVSLMRPGAESRGQVLSLHLPAVLPGSLLVDVRRLRQILFNLLSNAIKYGGTGSVRLLLEATHPTPASGAPWRLRFSVIDTGPGLSEAQLARLGALFQRGSDGPEVPDGSGVGLQVTRELVQLMGGDLQLCSREGEGTVVSFELALAPTGIAPEPLRCERCRETVPQQADADRHCGWGPVCSEGLPVDCRQGNCSAWVCQA